MATAYSLSDTTVKDAGGAKMFALPNIKSSTTDFALTMGIGASTLEFNASRIFAYQGVATAIAGSPVTNAIAGVHNLLAYTTNASVVATNDSIPQRGTDRGEMYVTGLSMTTCTTSGSTETLTVGSGLIHRFIAAGCGLVAGAQVALLNGGTSLCHLVFSGAFETLPVVDWGIAGTSFGSLRVERRGSVGSLYATAIYRNWGQG